MTDSKLDAIEHCARMVLAVGKAADVQAGYFLLALVAVAKSIVQQLPAAEAESMSRLIAEHFISGSTDADLPEDVILN